MGDGVAPGRTEDFLGIRPGDVVAFIGGGGKSALIHAIATRLAREGRKVLTTATRPFGLSPSDSPHIFLTEERPPGDLLPNLSQHGILTVAPERLPDGRFRGFHPDEVDVFADLGDYLFVEAEDSGGMSLPPPPTCPRPIPAITTVLCAVAGLDALGADLDSVAFSERLTGPGSVLGCRPDIGRRILLLNKADRHSVRLDGARVARAVAKRLGPEVAAPGILVTSVRDFLK